MSTDETVPVPVRPSAAAAAHVLCGATAALFLLVVIGAFIHEPVLIPPLAASAALIHSAPGLPIAQPRNVVGGHLICAAVGLAAHALLGNSPWVAVAAVAAALGATMLTRTQHSPACATTVITVLQGPAAARFLPTLAGACVLLVLAGYLASRSRTAAPRYPAYGR